MDKRVQIISCILLIALALTACGGGGSEGKKAPPSASKSAADLHVTDQREIEIEIEDARILSLSPDGRWLVVEKGRDQLCVYQTESLTEQSCALLEYVRLAQESVTWSPDSTRVAFTDNFKYMVESDLWIMEADSGKLTNLTDDGVIGGFLNLEPGVEPLLDAIPAWSPDGKSLIFARSIYERDKQPGTDIYRISAGGGDPEKLLTVGDECSLVVWHGLQWSGDGKKILYTVSFRKPDDPDNGVWIAERDGKNPRHLIGPDPEMGPPMLADVSARGDKALIVYWQAFYRYATKPNTSYFFILDLKTSEVEPLKQAKSEEFEFFGPSNAIFSPDGSKVLYVYRTIEKEWRLVVHDLDDETENILAMFDEPVGASMEMGMGLNWATDDTLYIAKSLGRAGLLLTLGTD